MEWLAYRFRVSGELYWDTLYHLDDAWNSYTAGHNGLCDFGGNGDGALFYPGTPAKIGGTTHIPVESQRLKLIREGMEDYEYLHLLESLGGGATAQAAAQALFPAAFETDSGIDALYQTRSQLADAIEALQPKGTGAIAVEGPVGIVTGSSAGPGQSSGCQAVPGRHADAPLVLLMLAGLALVRARARRPIGSRR
jgi:hypothetical protein